MDYLKLLRVLRNALDFLTDLGREMAAKRGAFWEPKWGQIGTKIYLKSKCEFKNEKVASWARLGSFGGRFRGASGKQIC